MARYWRCAALSGGGAPGRGRRWGSGRPRAPLSEGWCGRPRAQGLVVLRIGGPGDGGRQPGAARPRRGRGDPTSPVAWKTLVRVGRIASPVMLGGDVRGPGGGASPVTSPGGSHAAPPPAGPGGGARRAAPTSKNHSHPGLRGVGRARSWVTLFFRKKEKEKKTQNTDGGAAAAW